MARANGMAQIAGQTGLSREQLYGSFSSIGDPTLKTTLAVMKALGIELTATPMAARSRAAVTVMSGETGTTSKPPSAVSYRFASPLKH